MGGARHRELEQSLDRIASEAIRPLGLERVDLQVRGSSVKRLVRVDIDRAGAAGVGLDDCRDASRAIERALDESGLLAENYTLEVSSPGLDRPIRSLDDIRRNTGRRVVVTVAEQPEGTRTLRGVLLGSAYGELRLDGDHGEVRVPLDRVAHAQQEITI